jgi:hypothetical protein
MRLVLAPKVAVVEEDTAVAEEDEVVDDEALTRLLKKAIRQACLKD